MRPLAPLILLLAGCATPLPAPFVDRGLLPARVHAAEDFETDIEKRWWLAGQVEVDGPNRVCRGTPSKDFDDKMGVPGSKWTAVVFNPVPGPPMGPNTRLSFRYKLKGTDALRVQLFSLSKNYHRRLQLSGLPRGEWREACVDMTLARRPDGSGGPLAADERIDDIQFYVDPAAELWIDDIVLFDAAREDELQPFPRRVIFTAWFDTGAQGKEWPGDFEILPHEKPRAWKFARAKNGVLRVDLRGERPATSGRFRFLARGQGFVTLGPNTHRLTGGSDWKFYDFPFQSPGPLKEIRFSGDVSIDDVLIYIP